MNRPKRLSELKMINIVTAIAGAFLFVSPWLFGFSKEHMVCWSAWITGLVIAGFALAAVFELQEWEQWMNLALGLWVAVSPGMLGFADAAEAAWTHVAVGLGVEILAALELLIIHLSPRNGTVLA
jgi:hypothetical protein